MSLHIIIDGYNLIRQSQQFSELDLKDLQLGRDALIVALAAYKRIKLHNITVVFDGANAPGLSPPREQLKGIRIVFSRHGETADTVIKRMAAVEKERALVVTSDRDIVRFAETHGAAVIGSSDFENKLMMASVANGSADGGGNRDLEGWKPTTKKKGPRRRLSKKARRQKNKLGKL
ncbi:MAG: NYN domain-containing protein [Desulfobacterales bacterium]|nr:NYN domain-containing protein [Desulfobacterales bacterium]